MQTPMSNAAIAEVLTLLIAGTDQLISHYRLLERVGDDEIRSSMSVALGSLHFNRAWLVRSFARLGDAGAPLTENWDLHRKEQSANLAEAMVYLSNGS
jgi:hypothetical protein